MFIYLVLGYFYRIIKCDIIVLNRGIEWFRRIRRVVWKIGFYGIVFINLFSIILESWIVIEKIYYIDFEFLYKIILD